MMDGGHVASAPLPTLRCIATSSRAKISRPELLLARSDPLPDFLRYRHRTMGFLVGVDPDHFAAHEPVTPELPIRPTRAPTSRSQSNRTGALYSMTELTTWKSSPVCLASAY